MFDLAPLVLAVLLWVTAVADDLALLTRMNFGITGRMHAEFMLSSTPLYCCDFLSGQRLGCCCLPKCPPHLSRSTTRDQAMQAACRQQLQQQQHVGLHHPKQQPGQLPRPLQPLRRTPLRCHAKQQQKTDTRSSRAPSSLDAKQGKITPQQDEVCGHEPGATQLCGR